MPEEKWFSHVQLFATPWTIARQAPLSMGFPRQEYWSGHFLLQSMPESVLLLGVTQSTRLNQLSRNKLGFCSTCFWLPPQISLLCNPARRSLCSVLLSRTGFPQERNSELPSSLVLLSWDRHLRSLTWHPWWWRDDTWGGDTSDGEESALQCRRPEFSPWGGKIWRRAWQPTPVFLPGESHGHRSLVGYSPRGRKELDMTEWLILSLSSEMNSRASPPTPN